MTLVFNKKAISRSLSVVGIFSVLLGVFPVSPASAATLTTPRDYVTRQKAALTTGEKHQVFFTPVTGITNGKVLLVFPDADDGLWCRTAGSDLTVSALTDPLGGSESATNLPGTLAGSCAQGSGGSSFDTITVTFTGTINSGTKYGFSVTDGATGKLGTAATANNIKVTLKTQNNSAVDQDSSTFALALVADDQIAISATVDVTLSVSLSTNTAALGTLSTAQVSQSGVDTTVSTSAAGGYISLASYNATLTSGVNTIADTSGGTIAAGEAEYGVSSSQSGNTVTQWSPTACSTTGTTSNATALSTTPKSFASASGSVSGQATTLCFLASIDATQAAGSYTSTATIVTTAKY